MTVVDYSYSRPNLDQLKAQGVVGVMRYLSYPSGKVITASERDAILSRGLMLGLNWEYTNRDIHIDNGIQHAKEALRQARALNYPKGSAIYFSCGDHDLVPSEAPALRVYLKNCRVVLGSEYKVGLYGGKYPLNIGFNENLIDVGWHSCASHGYFMNGPPYPANKHPKASLYQKPPLDQRVAGGTVDFNDIHPTNPLYIWGEDKDMPITDEDAKKIALEVWKADVIPSGRPDNVFWWAANALGHTMNKAEAAAAQTIDYELVATKVVEKLGPISSGDVTDEELKAAVTQVLKEIFGAI